MDGAIGSWNLVPITTIILYFELEEPTKFDKLSSQGLMLHTRDGIAPRSCHWMEYYVLGYVWFSLVNEEGWTWLCEIHCLHQRYRFCHDLLSFSSSLSFPHESDPLWLFMIIKLLLLEVKWLPLIFLVDFIVGIFFSRLHM